MDYLYIVPTKKEVLVTIRIAPEVRDAFKTVAELRGSTMSGLMHQYIVNAIREEREMSPQAFKGKRHLAPVVAHLTSAAKEREEIQRRLDEGIVPIAARSKHPIPMPKSSEDKTHTQAKRKTR